MDMDNKLPDDIRKDVEFITLLEDLKVLTEARKNSAITFTPAEKKARKISFAKIMGKLAAKKALERSAGKSRQGRENQYSGSSTAKVASVKAKKKKDSKKEAPAQEKKDTSPHNNSIKNHNTGSFKDRAKRFINYDDTSDARRKYKEKPVQDGKTKGKVDGDLKGRFKRYYSKKGEGIRHAVAKLISLGKWPSPAAKAALAAGRKKRHKK